MHIFISLHFFSIVGQTAELSYFAFRAMEWTEDHDVIFASRNPGERFVFIQKRKRCEGRKVGIDRRKVKSSEGTQFSS